jgi:hypothetical protein
MQQEGGDGGEFRAALLLVRLDRGADADPRYEAEWGWTPGVNHTVVFYGFGVNDGNPDSVGIGDPAAGREHWNRDALRVLWHGEGLWLVKR